MDASDYSGREKIEHDEISLPMCRRMAALLDLDPAALAKGDEMPLAWSSLLFPSAARQSEIGADGHPRRGEFLPEVALPRRRFAGRQVEMFQPLHIGDRLSRRSTIANIVEKEGRSGPMVFVTVLHEISAGGTLAYRERQNIVYLDVATPGAAAKPRDERPHPSPDWSETVAFDPVMLFRYSALTFNGHRIHYDRDYAASEGYPALVINGGLTTLFLLELARRHLPARIMGYTMRALNILFAGTPVQLCGSATGTGAALWAIDADGKLAMQIDVTTGR